MKHQKLLLCLLIPTAIAMGLGWWQRNNLSALLLYAKTPHQDLIARMEDNRQQMSEAAEKATGIAIRELTEEEKQGLKDNTVSRDALILQLIGETPEQAAPHEAPSAPQTPDVPQTPAPAKPVQPETPPAPAAKPQPTEAELRKALAGCVADLLVMQQEYTHWLEEADKSAIAEFVALPREKQTPTKKYAIGMKYMNLAKEKEAECDRRVGTVEDTMTALLKQLGEDNQLVRDVHATYLNEKSTKKAYYLGLH